MTKFTTKTVFAAALLAIAVPSVSLAQNNNGGQQRAPDLSAVTDDLGVNEVAFQTCMPRPERSAEGSAPSRPDLDAVASCLQNAGSSLSVDQIKTVLENNRPERPQRQQG